MKIHHALNVAPIKIVEHYEQFKDAIKNGDFARAREHLLQMRQYQGGEKLAKDLESEFREEMQQFDIPEELPEPLLFSEEKAKQILSCLDLFDGFLQDERFDLAREQIEKIRALGDDDFAYNLEQKLVKAKNKALKRKNGDEKVVLLEEVEEKENRVSTQLFLEIRDLLQTSFPDAVRLFEEKHALLDAKDVQWLEKNIAESFQNYKKQTEEAFFEALENDRTTLANNIVEKSVLSLEEKRKLFDILESKKEEKKEEGRVEKVQEASSELDAALISGDFKSAQKLLTKLKHLCTEREFQKFQEQFFQAENKEQSQLSEAMKRAFEKNLSEKQFDLAKKNLRDLKKILSLEDYQSCVHAFDRAVLLVQKLEHTEQFWKNHHKKRSAFHRAIHAFHNKNEKDLVAAKQELLELGEGEVSLFFERIKQPISQTESDPKELFSQLLAEEKFDEAEKFLTSQQFAHFEAAEIALLKKQCEEKRNFSYLCSMIRAHEFVKVRKLLEKEKQSSHYLELLTRLHQEEKNQLQLEKDAKVQELENLLQVLFDAKNFAEAKQNLLRFLELGNADRFQFWKQTLENAHSAEEISEIEEEIEALKKAGKFDEALKKSEELLSKSSRAEHEKLQMQIALEKSQFERAQYEGFIAYLKQEIDAGNQGVFRKSLKKLQEEDIQNLEKYIAEKEYLHLQKERISEFEHLKSLFERVDFSEKKNVLLQMASFSDVCDVVPFQEECARLEKEQEEKAMAELLHNIHYALLQEDFDEVKQLAHALSEKNPDESARILQRCFEQEEEKAKKQFFQHISSLFQEMHRLCSEKKYEACSDIFFSHEEILADVALESQRKSLLMIVKEVAHYAKESNQFPLLEKCIHFLQRFGAQDVAEKFQKSLHAERRNRIEQFQLKGAKEFVRLKTVIAHYQSWKKDFQEGKKDSVSYAALLSLGEENFVGYLKDFMNRKGEVVEVSRIAALLQESDLEVVKTQGIEHFSEYSFSELSSLFRQFWTLEHVKKEEEKGTVFEKMKSNIQEAFDAEKRRKVSLKRFLSIENLLAIGENNANILLDFIHYKETALVQAEKTLIEQLFRQFLQEKAWQDAEDLLWKMSFEDYVLNVQSLWDAQELAEKNVWEQEWKELSSSLQILLKEKQFQEAWKDFEQAFTHIPYKLFFSEFSSLLLQFESFFAEQMSQLKMAVYHHMEAGNIQEAQKTLAELQVFERDYLHEVNRLKNHFQVLQELSAMIDTVLEQGDFDKANTLIAAHANDLEVFDTQWLEYRIEKAKSKKQYEQDLQKCEQAALFLDSLNISEAEEILSHIQSASLVFLLQKNIEKTKEQQQKNAQFEEFFQSLDHSFFDAEKNIKNISDLAQYVQAVFAWDAKRFSFLALEWENIAHVLQASIVSQSVQEVDFQKAEDFLRAVFFEYEASFSWLESYEQIWNELISQKELFSQDQFEHFLYGGEMEKAFSLAEKFSYSRFHFYLMQRYQSENKKYASSFVEQQIRKAFQAAKEKHFEQAKEFLFACKQFPSLEVFEKTVLELYNEEAETVESSRISTLQMLQADVKKSLQFQKWKQAEKIMQQIQALSLDGEYEQSFALYQSARDEAQKEAMKHEKLQQEQRKQSKKQYEAFVWKAFSEENLDQASKFIGEIRHLGDHALADRLMKEYEELHKEHADKQYREDVEGKIKLYISQKEWDKMEEMLVNAGTIIDEKQLQSWKKELERAKRLENKQGIVEDIERALQKNNYQQVLQGLSLLQEIDAKLWKEFLHRARKQKQTFIHELIHKEKFAEAEFLLELF